MWFQASARFSIVGIALWLRLAVGVRAQVRYLVVFVVVVVVLGFFLFPFFPFFLPFFFPLCFLWFLSDACLVGTSSGPTVSSCSGSWAWTSGSCPGSVSATSLAWIYYVVIIGEDLVTHVCL